MSGAVARVAAAVSAEAVGERAAERPAQAQPAPEDGGQRRRHREDAEDGGEGQLPADVGGNARIDRLCPQRRNRKSVETG